MHSHIMRIFGFILDFLPERPSKDMPLANSCRGRGLCWEWVWISRWKSTHTSERQWFFEWAENWNRHGLDALMSEETTYKSGRVLPPQRRWVCCSTTLPAQTLTFHLNISAQGSNPIKMLAAQMVIAHAQNGLQPCWHGLLLVFHGHMPLNRYSFPLCSDIFIDS